MEEQGKIISTCDIDKNLALQIWTRGKTPRLSIMNKAKNSRKLIHIAWVEKKDRTISINGKKPGENFTYKVQDFEPAIQKILAEFAVKTNFRVKFFTTVVDLEKALCRPEPATSPADLAMMTEDKRSSLWVADCSKPNEYDDKIGMFRPFFPLTEAEAAILKPESLAIKTTAGRTAEALIKTGIPDALKKVNPARWHNTIRVTAAAMMLGFSYCGVDGTKKSDALWTAGEKPKVIDPNITVMKAPVKKLSLHDADLFKLGHKLTAYIRHMYEIENISVNYEVDGIKFFEDAGFEKSRRIDFNTGTLGDVPYRTTFFSNESEGVTGFSCSPRMATAKHNGDMIITLPTEIYKRAVKDDTLGADDEFFTLTRLLWAKEFSNWYESIKPYVKKIAGLIDA